MRLSNFGRSAFVPRALIFVLLGVAGCTVPIAAGLDENDANNVVVALEKNGVAANKEPDPESEAHWRVTVAKDDASVAVTVLSHESLPPSRAPGVLDALSENSIVPSRSAEHAKLTAGTAGDLERSLRAVDGVLSARVHLAVPEADPLANDVEPLTPTASVLMRHRGATPPISAADVQRLIAGAVPGLVPAHVNVVATAIPAPGRPPDRELSRIGPITVTRSSLNPLKYAIGAAALVNIVLLGLMLALWSRMRQAQVALNELRSSADTEARG